MVLDRRGFMKFIAGASAGIMATPVPWKLLDDVSIWSQNWSWIPRNQYGESTYVKTVSKLCPSGVPMRIRLVDGRPVRVLPVEGHPLGGGVTALAVGEVQMLHSPGRVKRPLKKAPDGSFIAVDWDEASDILEEKLEEAGSSVAFISGDETGSTNELLSAFAEKIGSSDVFLMPSEGQCAARAAELMGIEARIGYDLENSDYVLAIGANLLESWGTVVRNRRIFQSGRPHAFRAKGSKTDSTARTAFLAYAGAVQNNTAAVADTWLPMYPGLEGVLAMGIANRLIAKGRTTNAYDFSAFKTVAAKYTPEEVQRLAGVDPKRLEAVVDGLLAAKAPLVIVGSGFNQGLGAAPIMAGFMVNALLGNINRPGGISLIPPATVVVEGAAPSAELYNKDLVSWMAGGPKPGVLFLHEANPVYALPNPEGVKAALKAMPFKVSFSSFMDETAALCDLIIPTGMGLERVDDLDTPYGCGQSVYCVTMPASQPQKDVRSTAEAVLYLAKEMEKDLGFESFEDVLAAKGLLHEKCSFDVLAAGHAAVNDEKVEIYGFNSGAAVIEQALNAADSGGKLRLAPYAKLNLGTAKTGIPPYNTKTLRASELDGNLMSVMMNKKTAAKLGLADGSRVRLTAGKQAVPAKLRVFEGIMHDTVAVCLGYGHTALDEFSQNKGANVMELLTAAPEPATGLSVWTLAGVSVEKA